MPAGTTFRQKLLELLFNNIDITGIGDASGLLGSASDGSFYVSLHSADPNAGNQTTNEVTYTSYARVAVARAAGGWIVVSNTVTNVAPVTFPTSTGGSDTATHFAIGTASSGAGLLVVSGSLSASLPITPTDTPSFIAGTMNGSVT